MTEELAKMAFEEEIQRDKSGITKRETLAYFEMKSFEYSRAISSGLQPEQYRQTEQLLHSVKASIEVLNKL